MWPYTVAESRWISEVRPRVATPAIEELSPAQIEAHIREGQRLRSRYVRASARRFYRWIARSLRRLPAAAEGHRPAMPRA